MGNELADTTIRNNGEAPHLKRVLGLWDLVFYGIVLNQPVAAVGLFGLVSQISKGHMVTTLLLSMIAMSLTAISYGRMAAIFPSAGSAFTYVGRGLNPHAGFLAGWVMVLCYLIIPIINTVYGVLSIMRLFPSIPYNLGVIVFIIFISSFNLLGVRSSMKANKFMLYIMLIIITAFVVLAVKYIASTLGWNGLLDSSAIINKPSFKISSIAGGTALVALTYVGFDGITTLAEDVKNPSRNILLAIIIVCVFTGLFSALQMYLAQLSAKTMWLTSAADSSIPFYDRIPSEHIETAFMTVCARVGGAALFNAMTITMFIACLGSGMAGQLGAARLLYGMGRENVLPRKFFSHLGTKNNNPVYNIILIGILSVTGALLLNYQKTAELINFAALVAFMGVNIAAINQFWFKSPPDKRNFLRDFLIPAAGFTFCLWIWISLPGNPKIIGGIWLIAGIIYLFLSTRGFKKQPVPIDFKDV
ncbi:MAG TPA: APC family permease [Bacteroidales bacterium]|nr:APC family permease [Bacteroidales bacterium]